MICTISGILGGGKSATACEWMLNHWSKGGVVATNVNIQLEPFEDQYGEKAGLIAVLKKYYKWDFQDGQLIRLDDFAFTDYVDKRGKHHEIPVIQKFYELVPQGTPELPVMVVIDEGHIHFPQDGYRSIPVECFHFLTLSRHNSVDVVMITQHVKNVWNQYRRLSEFHFEVRDMQKHGLLLDLKFFKITIPWFSPNFRLMKYDSSGEQAEPAKFPLKKKYVFDVYKSPDVAAGFETAKAENNFEGKGGKGRKKLTDYLGGERWAGVRAVTVGLVVVMLMMTGCNKLLRRRVGSLQSVTDKASELVSSSESSSTNSVPDFVELYKPYSWVQSGDDLRVYLGSDLVELGSVGDYGECVYCTKKVLVFDLGGFKTIIHHVRSYEASEPVKENEPPPSSGVGSVASGGGQSGVLL